MGVGTVSSNTKDKNISPRGRISGAWFTLKRSREGAFLRGVGVGASAKATGAPESAGQREGLFCVSARGGGRAGADGAGASSSGGHGGALLLQGVSLNSPWFL